MACPTREGCITLLRAARIHRSASVVRPLFYLSAGIPPLDQIAQLPDYRPVNRYMPDGYARPVHHAQVPAHRLPSGRLPARRQTSGQGPARTTSD